MNSYMKIVIAAMALYVMMVVAGTAKAEDSIECIMESTRVHFIEDHPPSVYDLYLLVRRDCEALVEYESGVDDMELYIFGAMTQHLYTGFMGCMDLLHESLKKDGRDSNDSLRIRM